MSEQFLIDQLDEALDAIIARRHPAAFTKENRVLTDLASLGLELRGLPREGFKSNLRATLRRSTIMTTTGTATQESAKNLRAGYQTITPYLTVKRAEQLVE